MAVEICIPRLGWSMEEGVFAGKFVWKISQFTKLKELLKKRPVVPDAESLAKMMRAEDVADCIVFSINMPSHVIIEEMIVRPR